MVLNRSPLLNKPYCSGYPFCCTNTQLLTNHHKKIEAERRTAVTDRNNTCFTKKVKLTPGVQGHLLFQAISFFSEAQSLYSYQGLFPFFAISLRCAPGMPLRPGLGTSNLQGNRYKLPLILQIIPCYGFEPQPFVK